MIRRLTLSLAALSLFAVGASFAACSTETIIQNAPAPAPTATEELDAEPPPPDAAPDAGPPKPKPKLEFPEVLSRGGPVIKAPKVVPIIFPGDPLAANITSFTAKIAASEYWKTLAAEYGIGPIAPVATITVGEAAPTTTTVDGIESWLAQKLMGPTPEFGAPDADTLYAIYYPASTTITDDGSGFGQSCQGYGGYHFEITVTGGVGGGKQVGYAVMPRCAGVDDLTVTASHEYFEWATDPFPKSKPAFNRLDDNHWAWQVTMIGELSDLCTYLDRDSIRPAEIGFDVQRHWSNKASLAGKYPCAPAKPAPYLQAITAAEDLVDVPDYGDRTGQKFITTKSVRVPPGGSRTVDALIYSDQAGKPTVPLRALSHADFGSGNPPSGFTFELDKNQAKVGDSVKVTINAPTKPGYDILVMAAYTGSQSAHYWPVLVINDDEPAAQGKRPVLTAEMLPKYLHPRSPLMRPFTTLGMGQQRRLP
jgi:hypothetical protein